MTSENTENTDWLLPPAAPVDEVASTGLPGGLSKRLKVAGIVGTAVVVGFIGVLTVQGSSAAPSARSEPGGLGGPAAQTRQGGPPGGFAGRGLQGTVEAVSASSITVAGTTVKLTSATQVLVNGAPGSLSDITKGATAFVRTEGTGSSRYAERVLIGYGGPGFGPPPAQPPGDLDHT
jgi:hypothetical protein